MKQQLEEAIRQERIMLRKKKRQRLLLSCVSLLLFFGIWECVVRFKLVNTRYIVPPSQVIRMLVFKFNHTSPDGATLWKHMLTSMQLSFTGFCLAILVGTPLGLLMGWYRPVDKFVKPIFNLIRPIPAVGWIPVMIVILGIGVAAKSSIIFLSAFVPTVINAYTGIKLTNGAFVNAARTCGASNWYIFLHVGVPSALPMVFTGWKVALGLSWSTLVAAEMLASNTGLGYMILIGRQFFKIDLIICGMMVIGLIGVILYMLLGKLERFVLKWRV